MVRAMMSIGLLATLALAEPALAQERKNCEELEREFAAAPAADLLFRLADCKRRLHDFAAASAAYTRFVTLYKDDLRVTEARKHLAKIEAQERRQRRAHPAPKPGEEKWIPPTRAAVLAVLEFRNHIESSAREVDAGYIRQAAQSEALRVASGLQLLTSDAIPELGGRDCARDCQVEAVRKLGADLVLTGDLNKIGSKFKLNLILHDARTGEMLAAAEAHGKTAEELAENTPGAVGTLLAPIQHRLPSPPRPAERLIVESRPPAPAEKATPLPEAPAPPPVTAAPIPREKPVAPAEKPAPAPAPVLEKPVPPPAHPVAGLQHESAPPPSGSRTWTWIAGGAAAVAFGFGGALGLQSRSTASSITAGGHARADLDSLRSRYTTQAHAANVLFAVGGGLAAVSAACFVFRF